MLAVQIQGYEIPAGTVLVPSIAAPMCDAGVFAEPDAFDPGRFLDADGRFLTKLDGFHPFGVGKRQCVGEAGD